MEEADEAGEAPRTGARHIKKRALKNKALSVSFDEKDLQDYVTGFHKRKKKRRKEAQLQLQEVQRRKRIEGRKKRKLEREFALYGGAPAEASAGPDEDGDNSEHDEESDPVPSISVEGTTMYDNGDVQFTVKTSEISREEEEKSPSKGPQAAAPKLIGGDVKKHSVPVNKKKPFKRVANNRSRRKPQNKRGKNKEKKRNKKR
ncbi:LOW QUALITY PROTEIN: ribosomal RNA-processing protein 17 [Actinidia eriantha]|uniref:LOW QUALITY PROTEIN: ribosomal RNA-processing protein 17 n=1 Tax=Actinidia eriantha TaxID=165200 RepID=UPI00258607C3|nr:LOW QUALITY PROTEIN: ribosomal RNA-processing protein 17 [Actinidia eriantha]